MTEGESFYFILAAFYLLECLKLAPPDGLAFVSRFGGARAWRPRPPFTMAWGLRKAAFWAPILPWPSLIVIVAGKNENEHARKRIRTVSGIRRRARFLARATARLRALSVVSFIVFMIALPFFYGYIGDPRLIFAAVGFGYLTLATTAVHFYALHRRILPDHKSERFKSTIYTALLPWHAMRCADELFIGSAREWSALATLAANAQDRAALDTLKRLWRAARWHPRPPFAIETMDRILAQARLDPAKWLDAPTDGDSPQYCPICYGGYESSATHCADCRGIALQKSPAA